MPDPAILLEWAGFAARWLHVITAMAWIGTSFYFIALDLGLRRAPDLPEGAHGEEWQVHGGGFYHIRKYLVAPAQMPAHLTWFKWESYATWLSGAALLMLVYWVSAELYLLAPDSPLSLIQGIAVSAGSLAIGWLVYDRLCKSGLAARPTLLMLLLWGMLIAMGWAYTQVFTGRAMMLHLGAFTATIMTANVFLIIMPNQRIVVADLRAGRTPEARYGQIAKLRSTHNNYLTLPVVFLMLSTHYPLAFATTYNWIIAALVFLMGVTIRHFFNTLHARRGPPWWTWGATALIFATIIWLSSLGALSPAVEDSSGAAAKTPAPGLSVAQTRLTEVPGFHIVQEIVALRCSMCHAATPVWPGLSHAPKGVILETPADLARQARALYLQAGLTHAMPPANLTWMEPAERASLIAWYRAGQSAP
ncbi:urate hydroxylase PuuD [Roseovarius sp.]|uniref:urate hydroxylase PuuD n=1 Tax=Roseovarius sp. TaxID=1486281 RepID=UPI003A96B6D1